MFVKIFTDGAARGNPDGPGGYGTILQYIDSWKPMLRHLPGISSARKPSAPMDFLESTPRPVVPLPVRSCR